VNWYFLKTREARLIVALLLFALVALQIAPLLELGYVTDDAYNSQIKGTLVQSGQSLFGRTYDEIRGWTLGAGRFYPLSFGYTYPLFYFVTSLQAYRLIAFFAILLGVAVTASFLAVWFKNRSLGVAVFLVTGSFLQTRAWHDPLLGFGFLVPMVFLFVSASLFLFVRSIDQKSRRLLLFAWLLYVVPCLTYEIAYFMSALFFLVALERKQSFKIAIKTAAPFLVTAGLFVVLALVLKSKLNPYFSNAYPGANIKWYFPHVYKTFFVQAWSSFPLSYFLKVRPELASILNVQTVFIGFAFAGASGLAMFLAKSVSKVWTLALFGLALIAVPSAPLALSEGHQKTLLDAGFGYGYIPVFVQYFGAALLVIALSVLVSRIRMVSLRVLAQVMLACFVGFVASVHRGHTMQIVKQINPSLKFPRTTLEASLKHGFLDSVPEGSIIVRNERWPGDHSWNYSTHTGKSWTIVTPELFAGFLETSSQKDVVDVHKTNPGFRSLPIPARNAPMFPKLDPLIWTRVEGQKVLNLSKWPVYALGYLFDAHHGRFGRVYLSRVDSVVLSADQKSVASLVARSVTVFDLSTSAVATHEFGSRAIDFAKVFAKPISPTANEFETMNLEKFFTE
jgi:hypothetical protein